jgi:hypothetical protein
VPNGDDRPRKAIETAEAWAHGQEGVTLDMVRAAADAAAAYAARAADAAADAAAYAYAARAAARAAAAAAYAYAAYAADAAARAAAAAYAKNKTLAKCANIVRKYYPKPPRMAKEAKP